MVLLKVEIDWEREIRERKGWERRRVLFGMASARRASNILVLMRGGVGGSEVSD